MSRTLYLHVGHGKTGSSWIQSLLAVNRVALTMHGVDYPAAPDQEAAVQGRTTSGNACGWFGDLERLDNHLSTSQSQQHRSVLLSSEFLFDELVDWEMSGCAGDHVRRLQALLEKHRFDAINILLFIRNPLSHAASHWQQRVKREGETRLLSEYLLAGESAYPRRVASFLDLTKKIPECTVNVVNYSRERTRLISVVAGWIGIHETRLRLPDRPVINRSLAYGELELQRQLNIAFGGRSFAVASRMADELPSITSSSVSVPEAVQRASWNDLLPYIRAVNDQIRPHQWYQFDPLEGDTDQAVCYFEPAQLKVLAQALKDEMIFDACRTDDFRSECRRLLSLLEVHQLEIKRLEGIIKEHQIEIRRLNKIMHQQIIDAQGKPVIEER